MTRNVIKKNNPNDEIHTVECGEDALQFLMDYALRNENKCPGMIFMDMKMPMMDGIQFLGFLKDLNFENLAHVKIIVLSNFPLQNEVTDFKKSLQIVCIEKPLTIENLNKALISFTNR